MGEFKEFLLNESKLYLGQRIGDILNALHTLNDEGKHMGQRQLVKHAERVGAMIRRILHSSWPKKNTHHLQGLQSAGVAIMKALEDKGDLEEILVSSAKELERVLSDMGTPVNQLGGGEDEGPSKDKEEIDKPEHKPEHKKQEKDQPQNPQNPQNDPGQEPTPDDTMPQAQSPPPPGGNQNI
jgi:hypothetical protein